MSKFFQRNGSTTSEETKGRSTSSDNEQKRYDRFATPIRQGGSTSRINKQRYYPKKFTSTRGRYEQYSRLFREKKTKDYFSGYQYETGHNSCNFKSKWIFLRFGIDKRTELVFIDSRHFNTVQDILDCFDMKSCILKLYNEHGRQMHTQEFVSEMREYIVKRLPKQQI